MSGIKNSIGWPNIAGRIAAGSITVRVESRSPLIINPILMSGTLFLSLAAREIWMFYLCAIIFSFAYGSLAVLESPLVAELFHLNSHGAIIRVTSFGSAIIAAVGPVMVGRTFNIFNSYWIAFLICAAVCVLGPIVA